MTTKKKKRLVRKVPFTQAKAKLVLSEKNPMLQGRQITKRQRGLLGLIAGGGTPKRTLT